MKSKLLTALIIDKDPDQGKQFGQVVSKLFSKLYIEADEKMALEEFKNVRPDVVFINLNLSQRSRNFELLEKLEFSPEKEVIVFAVNDQVEDELLAHAIECGVHDIFVRPFDEDLISTKINRYFISDKTQAHELRYARLTPPLKAQVDLKFRLLSVDENGMTFKSENFISKGIHFPLASPLVADIFGQPEVFFMITKTWTSDDLKDFFVYAEPRDMSEEMSAALRRFILRKI